MTRHSSLFIALPVLFTALLLQACGGDTNQSPAATVTPATDEASAQSFTPTLDPLLDNLPADNDPDSKTFQTLDGRGFDVELFAGRKVFVNFWATWCAPCIQEIPSINNAAAELANENYLFVFASDEDSDTINNFLLDRQFPGNFIRLNDYFAKYGIGAVPSSWLLDENGDVIRTWAGAYEWDSAEMLAEIRSPASADAATAP